MIAPGGSLEAYRGDARPPGAAGRGGAVVVPGHGSPHPRDTALRILDEDVAYLDALERATRGRACPRARDTPRQREIHRDNLSGSAPRSRPSPQLELHYATVA